MDERLDDDAIVVEQKSNVRSCLRLGTGHRHWALGTSEMYNEATMWRAFWKGVREFMRLMYNEPPGC